MLDGIRRLSECIQYIESNLESEISMEEVTNIFCGSKFHFLRTFQMITGFTVAEYIRNRRLTLAAKELSLNEKVITVALKYGYETPESFSKAFRKLHGLNPSEVKKENVNLTAFPPLSFQITIKGEEKMDYKIKEKEAFEVVGKGIRVTTKEEKNFKEIPKFWDRVNSSSDGKILESHAGELGMLGICMEFDSHQESFTYFIGVEKGTNEVPEGFEVKQIPSATWAVFPVVGAMPDAIQQATKRIYSEWFPATGYEQAAGQEMEVYPPQKEAITSDQYKTELWVPIVKK